jgi:branched-chain amino acid transport system permease protein
MEKKVKRDIVIGVIVFSVYLLAGVCFGESISSVMSNIIIMTLFGISFNLQFGYSGMCSLGHAMYFGTGGYLLVILCEKVGMNLWFACLLTLLICVVFYALCGYICLRDNMMTFTFLSMGISLSLSGAVNKWTFLGGTTGLTYNLAPAWMSDYRILFLFILLVSSVCTVMIYLLSKSPFVAMLKGGRENEERLIFLGVNTRRLHNVIFVISGLFAAVAGMLFAVRNGGAYTASLDANLSFEAIIMCVMGGSENFFGPILGGFIVALIYNFLPKVTSYYQGILGIILLLVIYFMREGLISRENPLLRKITGMFTKSDEKSEMKGNYGL